MSQPINSSLVSSTLRSLCRCEEFVNNNYPKIIVETEYLLLNNYIGKMSNEDMQSLLSNYKNYNSKFKAMKKQDNKFLNKCIDSILNKMNVSP
jgi:hypothetical protein